MIKVLVYVSLLVSSLSSFAAEDSLYDFLWLDPDKKVYVLQNKLYKKEKKLFLEFGYVGYQSSKFQDTHGGGIRLSYYFHEEWALELLYQGYTNANNSDYSDVANLSNIEPFVRRPKSTSGALAIWSPFYGKINTFNQIFYFDWSFGLGVGQVQTESNIKTVGQTGAPRGQYVSESYTGLLYKTAFRFHVTENFHILVEYLVSNYQAPGPRNPKSDKLRSVNDFVFGAGFSF